MLDTLLAPLTAGDSGSKILVTTRFEDVAKALLGAQNLFPIPEIEEEPAHSIEGTFRSTAHFLQPPRGP